jgi:GT2 family glycosyltransferase
MDVELSYCVVNTERRQLLSYCLDAIARERATVDFETETLVLDNASWDGSAEAARAHPVTTEVIALEERRGRGEVATQLLRRAHGRFCLLLNEDSELEPGATAALHAALAESPDAGAAGATLVQPDGAQQPSAWRFPSFATRLLSLLGLKRRLVVQSHGESIREVDWAPAAALLVRRDAAEAVRWMGGDEVDFCRSLHAAGWRVLYVPEARAVHHAQ